MAIVDRETVASVLKDQLELKSEYYQYKTNTNFSKLWIKLPFADTLYEEDLVDRTDLERKMSALGFDLP